MFTVELAGAYMDMSLAGSGKFSRTSNLPQINYWGKLTCFDVVLASVITDLFA